MGLHHAFPDAEIIGVDLVEQPRYPFTFVQADAMTFPLDGYDLIWASPPCQFYSVMRYLPWNRDKDYPRLIEPTRERLREQHARDGTPWIIENVMGAQRKAQMGANWLCGQMFGRRFYRHRVFQTSFAWFMPLHPQHVMTVKSGRNIGPRARNIVLTDEPRKRRGLAAWQQAAADNDMVLATGHSGTRKSGSLSAEAEAAEGYNTLSHAPKLVIEAARQEMGIDWMTADGLSQAIPPIYAQYVASFAPIAKRLGVRL